MSKSQMLRVLVNARLTAAAEEIFALFERTVAEFEEELSRCKEENQRKQERLDSVLSPTVVLLRADLRTAGSPGPGLDLDHCLHQGLDHCLDQRLDQGLDQRLDQGLDPDQGLDQRLHRGLHQGLHQEPSRIKEEPAESCFKQESVSTSVCVKREELENDADWRVPFSCLGAQAETEAANYGNVTATAEGAEEKRPKCSVCNKTFGTKYYLKVHTRFHTGERPYSCTVCGKGFVVGWKLKLHMRTHTGERPFSCSVCGKTYMQKIHLDGHSRKHTGHRPYSCSFCPKTFSQHSSLSKHTRMHTLQAGLAAAQSRHKH